MSLAPQASRAVREAYLDLYLLAARFREGNVKPPQVQRLRQGIEASLNAHRERLFRAGVPEQWVNEIQLPVIGLMDESARRSPTPGVADNWASIQFPFYGHENVGRISFEHLDKLRSDSDTPLEVLEVYMRVLAMGFQGEYAPHRLEDLKILNEGLRNELNRRVGKLPPISPHLERGGAIVETPSILRARWIVALAAGAVLGLAVLLTIMLGTEAR